MAVLYSVEQFQSLVLCHSSYLLSARYSDVASPCPIDIFRV
jgi:hypothetical protein